MINIIFAFMAFFLLEGSIRAAEAATTDTPSADLIKVPGDKAVGRSLPDLFYDQINVRDYGAKCDGVTDDSDAFQAAITQATSSGTGRDVVVPNAVSCLLSKGLTVDLSRNAGLSFHAAGKHGATLIYPDGFTDVGINVVMKEDAASKGIPGARHFTMSGITMLHRGTVSQGVALRVREISGVMDPSLNLNHLSFSSDTGGSWAKAVDLQDVNVSVLSDVSCFLFDGICVAYDSDGPIAVEHHINDLYVHSRTDNTIGLSIGHAGMNAPLQGFTVQHISCTNGAVCIQAQGAPHAIDELIVQGAQINTATGIDTTNVDSLIVNGNYFLSNKKGVTASGGGRGVIANNVFMQRDATSIPVTLSDFGSSGAGSGVITGNIFTNNTKGSPIVLKGATNYVFVSSNNCFEQKACVDMSGVTSGYKNNVIGANNQYQGFATQSLSFTPPAPYVPIRLSGNEDKQLTLDWDGALYPFKIRVDGIGNTRLDAGYGRVILAPNVYTPGVLSVGDHIEEPTLFTPASATASCTQGQHSWDAHYEYRCVATNKWERWPRQTWK